MPFSSAGRRLLQGRVDGAVAGPHVAARVDHLVERDARAVVGQDVGHSGDPTQGAPTSHAWCSRRPRACELLRSSPGQELAERPPRGRDQQQHDRRTTMSPMNRPVPGRFCGSVPIAPAEAEGRHRAGVEDLAAAPGLDGHRLRGAAVRPQVGLGDVDAAARRPGTTKELRPQRRRRRVAVDGHDRADHAHRTERLAQVEHQLAGRAAAVRLRPGWPGSAGCAVGLRWPAPYGCGATVPCCPALRPYAGGEQPLILRDRRSCGA